MVDIKELERLMGEYEQRGEWYNFFCPFHHGESFKFGVNKKYGNYTCWVCDKKGSHRELLDFLVLGENRHSKTTSTHMSGKSSVTGIDPGPIGTGVVCCDSNPSTRMFTGGISEIYSHIDTCRKWFVNKYVKLIDVSESITRNRAIEYLTKRNIEYKKIDVGILEGYETRVTFPFYQFGELVFWQGRIMYDRPMKTYNSPKSKGWFAKSDVLYGIDNIKINEIVICEGIFDSYSVKLATGLCCVPLLGNTISNNQMKLLKKINVNTITVMLDSDANEQAINLSSCLRKNGFYVYICLWDSVSGIDKRDPNNVSYSEIRRLMAHKKLFNSSTDVSLRILYQTQKSKTMKNF